MKLNLKIVAATATVAMMSAGAASAASVTAIATLPAANTYSAEGLALTGNGAVTLPQIVVTFGNSLTYQDDILITLPGTTSLPATPSAGLVTCVGAGASSVGYVTTINGGWNFRVTDVNGVTVGAQCTFTGLQVTAASLSNTAGQLTYQANRGLTVPTVVVDGPVSSATAIVVKSQFAIKADQALNGIVNVYADRKSFYAAETVAPGTTAAVLKQADTLNFTTYTTGNPVPASGWSQPYVDTDTASVTITGDFSWVDGADTNTTCDQAEFAAALVGYTAAPVAPVTGQWTVNAASDCAHVVLDQAAPAAGASAVSQGYFYVPGTVTLSATDWTGSVTWAYHLNASATTKGSKTLAWDPGVWTMNGAQVYIQYMPYGTGLSRIIYAANRGSLTPQVTADITANGSVFSCPLGTVAPKTVASLSAGIDSCVAAKGITTGKVAILLTFIAPDADIEVYSAYNAGGTDRGTVVNTSNGRAFFYGTGVNFTMTPTP